MAEKFGKKLYIEKPPSKETLEQKLARKKGEQKDTELAAKIGNPFFDVERGFPKNKEEEGDWDKKIAKAKEQIEKEEWEETINKAKHGNPEGIEPAE